MGMIPKTTKAETKAVFGMTMQRLMGAMFTMMASFMIGRVFVHSSLNTVFIIVCLGLYFLLNTSAPGNPRKRLWQGLILFIKDRMSPRYYLSIIGYAYNRQKGGDVIVQDPAAQIHTERTEKQESESSI